MSLFTGMQERSIGLNAFLVRHRLNQTQLFIAKHAFSHSKDNSAKTGQTDQLLKPSDYAVRFWSVGSLSLWSHNVVSYLASQYRQSSVINSFSHRWSVTQLDILALSVST